MDLVQILRALWKDRLLVALGVGVALLAMLVSVFHVSSFPPSLTPRASNIASASTEVLIDSRRTFLGDLRREVAPLTERAGTYAHFVASDAVVAALADATGIPAERIDISGPQVNASEAAAPTAEQRANEIRQGDRPYRVQVDFGGELPILSIYAQAPTTEAAVLLANGMSTALRSVIDDFQVGSDKGVSGTNRVQIRQLGPAQGGVVGERASYVLGGLVFIGVLGAWCIFILVGRNVAAAWRRENETERHAGAVEALRPAPQPEPSRNGVVAHGAGGNGEGDRNEGDVSRRDEGVAPQGRVSG
jgi:hypothetical protein